jgi:4-alpha-glucanotransferase
LAESGQKVWQVLPLSPTGYGDSPYQCFSAFAGNPLLIDLTALREQGLLSLKDLSNAPGLSEQRVEYGRVIDFKRGLLREAAQTFLADGAQTHRGAFDIFCQNKADWLDDYALFMACKGVYKDAVWADWDPGIRQRDSSVLKDWQERLSSETQFHKFAQFEFFRQWEKLKTHCHRRGIRIMGDIPIFVAHDSADVWQHRDLFHLDEQGEPSVVAGVPPDYFSATGQLWGNPLYRWDVLAKTGYRWWIDRFRATLSMVDVVRLDHFRGFEAYWEVAGKAATAVGDPLNSAPRPWETKCSRSSAGE